MFLRRADGQIGRLHHECRCVGGKVLSTTPQTCKAAEARAVWCSMEGFTSRVVTAQYPRARSPRFGLTYLRADVWSRWKVARGSLDIIIATAVDTWYGQRFRHC